LGAIAEHSWTGRLRVRLRAESPLLVSEQSRGGSMAERRTRLVGEEVVIPSTSVKGMLRTEFEMVTNSRFGVFEQDEHERAGVR
jgi:CRISPR/Cas system CSM-associated protein Csm3 (group 7 of RAMP superfamily)